MNKKAIAILGAIFLLIIGTLGFLVYSKYSGSSTPKTADVTPDANNQNASTTVDTGPDVSGNPDIQNPNPNAGSKFFRLTESDQIISPVLFYNGNGITYLNSKGELIKSDFETGLDGSVSLTRTRSLAIPLKSGIEKVLWPKNGDDFIAQISGGGTAFSYFNFQAGNYTDLPKQVKAVEWLPGGDKILFIWVDTDVSGQEKATLNMAKPDTTEYSQVAELYEADDAIHLSPDGLNLLFYRTQNTGSVNKIILTDPQGKVWKDLVATGFNYGVLWSPDSQKFIFAKKAPQAQGYQLWYYDLYTGETKNLGIGGLPQKAVWGGDSRSVYVAAPKDETAIMDASDLNSRFTTDKFYKIDTSTLEKVEYDPGSMNIDGRELFLNPGENKLFFKNAQDGGLYYLDLSGQ